MSLVRIQSVSQMIEADKQAEASEAADSSVKPAVSTLNMDALTKHLYSCFEEAFKHSQLTRERFLEAGYAREGVYSPEKLRKIRETGGSEEFARIIANKARVLEAWLTDVFLGQSEPPWTIEPTPKPDLPEDLREDVKRKVSTLVAQIAASGVELDAVTVQTMLAHEEEAACTRMRTLAELRAGKMSRKIADQMAEGHFNQALSEFIAYLCTYPAAFLKGPIFRVREVLEWDGTEGTYIPIIKGVAQMEFEAPNPNNIYPSPGAVSVQDGYLCEHLTLTPDEIYAMIGADGYSEAEIRGLLAEHPHGLRWLDWVARDGGAERNSYQARHNAHHVGYFDVIEFNGFVQGRLLREWGVSGVSDVLRYYPINALFVGSRTIKASINPDPLGRRPYFKASYEAVPGKFWGRSPYDVLRDVQGVANAAVRSLCNNMPLSSGPQIVADIDRLAANETLTNVVPMRVWQTVTGRHNTSVKPIEFFMPESRATEFMGVLEKFYELADDFSLVPRYMSGGDRMSGPGRTASGLSMMLDAANKGLKGIVYQIDQNVIAPCVQQLFDYNMLNDPDTSIKGDARIVARGVMSMMQLETLRIRRNEFLNITANPVDSQIIGPQNRAAVLREVAKDLGMDVNKVVPPDAEITAAAAFAQGAPPEKPSEETLGSGAPVTDFASPSGMV